MKHTHIVYLLFFLGSCFLACANNWIWEEDFSGGLNGWTNSTPGAWDIGTDGKLTYMGDTNPGAGYQYLLSPEKVSLADGFRLRVEYNDFELYTYDGSFGFIFGADSAESPYFSFSVLDSGYGSIRWAFSRKEETALYMYLSTSLPWSPLPMSMEVQFNEDRLDLYIQDELVKSDILSNDWNFSVEDGYVGLMYNDYSGTSDEQVVVNSISYVPEPSTLLLLSFGGIALLRKRK